jgi:hypothetical protein
VSYTTSREQRRYRAKMPEAAWPRGREPRLRRRKRDAYEDLAAGLARHLASHGAQLDLFAATGSAAEWAQWALQLGAGCPGRAAPDGTAWGVTTRIDYV